MYICVSVYVYVHIYVAITKYKKSASTNYMKVNILFLLIKSWILLI